MGWTTTHIPDQSGRTALVTGASAGIGFETARVLAAHGAHVVLACRDTERGSSAAERIDGSTEVVPLDLASLTSVRQAAGLVRGRHRRLDLLVNNAGVMFPSYRRTKDGFEAHLGVNHLGHFALTGLLLDLMTSVPGSRVVTVASLAHRVGFGRLDEAAARSSTGRRSMAAYGRSKLANLMFARELQRRLAVAGAATVSVAAHPGLSPTALWHGDPPALARPLAAAGMRWLAQPVEAAALPSLRAAVDPAVHGGAYLGPSERFGGRGAPEPARSSRAARSGAERGRLWTLSEELTGVRYVCEPAVLETPASAAETASAPAVAVCPVTGARA
ncbi:oxidoreductase [Streptomyces sp. NPDC057193]|uniref:oxidoreductase n=1 Tax=unclassified Streptomyces TaxID=2593676 RepID=UPI000938C5E9|nr:oxidoreductase [Streptomyces sp. CB02261]OKJ52695.1 short-chain dehydrogenase [Streptomyces sp. CB02261]